MNFINTFIVKIKLFFSSYKWLLFPLIPIIIFIPIIIYFFSIQKTVSTTPATKHTMKQVIPSSVPSEISPTSESNQPYTLADEVNDVAFGKLNYPSIDNGEKGNFPGVEFAGSSINQETLPDGSIKYEYASNDPKRPDVQIIKNGVVIFRRSIITNTTLSTYSGFLTNPPYAAPGSTYFGPDAVILASPMEGIAVVYNPQTNYVYEQYLFQATSVADFENKFGQDITIFNPTP